MLTSPSSASLKSGFHDPAAVLDALFKDVGIGCSCKIASRSRCGRGGALPDHTSDFGVDDRRYLLKDFFGVVAVIIAKSMILLDS